MFIAADDQRLVWEGAVSLEKNNGSVIPWRIPYEDKILFPSGEFQLIACQASGVRLRFKTDSRCIKLHGTPMGENGKIATPDCQVDLCINNRIVQTSTFDERGEMMFSDLPEEEKIIELWFSPSYQLIVYGIEISCGTVSVMRNDTRPKWITYGSSITHCVRATSPAMTWPAIVSRKMNLNLLSLGFAGQCKIDPMIGRLIRDLDADFISLKLGINVYESDMSLRAFPAAVIGIIATIREKHSKIPLAVCSPIFSPHRETTPSMVGNTLKKMRDTIRNIVDTFHDRGDDGIYYVDGLKIFGPELNKYLSDGLHPNAKGMEFMAENFIEEVFQRQNIDLPIALRS